VEKVIAIELLAACQAIEFLRPLKTTAPLEEVYRTVRSVVRSWEVDRFMSPDIDAVTKLLKEEKVWTAVKHHIEEYSSMQNVESEVFSPTTSVFRGGPANSSKVHSRNLYTSGGHQHSAIALGSPPLKRTRRGGGHSGDAMASPNHK